MGNLPSFEDVKNEIKQFCQEENFNTFKKLAPFSMIVLDGSDAQSVVLQNEVLDEIGIFPISLPISEEENFDKLIKFASENKIEILITPIENNSITVWGLRPENLGMHETLQNVN